MDSTRVLRYWSIRHFVGFVAPGEFLGALLILCAVFRILEDRNPHLTGAVRDYDVVVEVWDGAGVEAHIADANGNDATGDFELELGK